MRLPRRRPGAVGWAGVLLAACLWAGCARPTLDADKAAAALRGQPRFAQPLVIGLPLEPAAGPPVVTAVAAARVLERRGDVRIDETTPLRLSLTPQGKALVGAGGWVIDEARPIRTLSVPVARRVLLRVLAVEPAPRGGILSFEWQWTMTDVGRALRAGGVRFQDWGLRIDDRSTFRGGARLTLSGDHWDVRIIRPPRVQDD